MSICLPENITVVSNDAVIEGEAMLWCDSMWKPS
jgi:hypothetical protein